MKLLVGVLVVLVALTLLAATAGRGQAPGHDRAHSPGALVNGLLLLVAFVLVVFVLGVIRER